jgi:hypothetical protein
MRTKTLVIVGLIVVFAAAIAWALLREVHREEATLSTSISGVVEVAPQLMITGQADVVRTDRLVLLLVDPGTRQPVALHFVTPLVPPQTIRIGQSEARDTKLSGPYLVVGITDKDGEIFKVTPGEIYGRSPQPVALGTEEYRLLLTEPFRGSLFNEAGGSGGMPGPMAGAPPAGGYGAGGAPPGGPVAGGPMGNAPMRAGPLDGTSDADPKFSIAGTITVSATLQGKVEPSDRLIILLFDPQRPQPVAFKIIPHTLLPQRFTITVPPEARAELREGYSLRVLTDKDNNPFGAAEGEVVGRSARPIALGTTDVEFVLDQPYVR